MSKKILILESSVTLQKLFTTTLDSDDYSIHFASDGKEALSALFEIQPELFLVNCDIQNPRSFEIVRIVRSIKCFKELSIGMYASVPTPLDESFAKKSGADAFIRLEQKTLVLNVDELAQLSSHKIDKSEILQAKKSLDDVFFFLQTARILSDVAYKNELYGQLAQVAERLEDLKEMIKRLLLVIAQV